jgi:hypothetical protein
MMMTTTINTNTTTTTNQPTNNNNNHHYYYLKLSFKSWGYSRDVGPRHSSNRMNYVRFQVLTAASMKIAVFWIVAVCGLVDVHWCCRGSCCLHHLWNASKLPTAHTVQQPRRQLSSVPIVSATGVITKKSTKYCSIKILQIDSLSCEVRLLNNETAFAAPELLPAAPNCMHGYWPWTFPHLCAEACCNTHT